MSWRLLDESNREIEPVFSFRLEQNKGKPAVLNWIMPTAITYLPRILTLMRGDECVFKGKVYSHPVRLQDDVSTWAAVAISDDYSAKYPALKEELNATTLLSSTQPDCEGAGAGFIHIDRINHNLKWIPMGQRNVNWDYNVEHDRDSVSITPIDQPLKGLTTSIKLSTNRIEAGMIEVGSYITSKFNHGIQTYSGAALEEQWSKLAFRAFRAGYDIHKAELIPSTHQRADLPKQLGIVDDQGQLFSIPYAIYDVKLLMGWSVPVKRHTTLTLSTTSLAQEHINLTLKPDHEPNESLILKEATEWMKAYALVRSFTTQVKMKVLVTEDININTLDIGSWTKLIDPRIQPNFIEGWIS